MNQRRARRVRVAAAAAGLTLGAGVPAMAIAEMAPASPSTSVPGVPAAAAPELQEEAVDDAAIAAAKQGLSTFLADHAGDLDSGAVFLPPDHDCPTMPAENLAWFAGNLGIAADPLAAFVSIDRAATAAPDLVTGLPSTTTSARQTAGAGTVVPVVTCGFGVPSGRSAVAPTSTTTATTGDTVASPENATGLPLAEGLSLRAAVFDDSTFAADITAANPEAQTVAPTAEGLDGEIVGHCAAGSDRIAATCTIWWHQDGLAIGLDLTGPTAAFAEGAAAIEMMVPVAVESLGAFARGETPEFPAPPTEPQPTAPPTEQIEFPEGADSMTVEGTVDRGEYASWAFRASAGQALEMSITATADNVTFNLYAPDGTQLAQNQISFTGALPASGNYAIEVGATAGTAEYALTLRVTGEPGDEPGDGRIEFPPGEDSATVSGTLDEGVVDTWTLRAAAGQSMEVLVYTNERNAVFSVYAPNGDRLAEGVPAWTGELPADRDYVIEVSSIGGQADYELAVVIT